MKRTIIIATMFVLGIVPSTVRASASPCPEDLQVRALDRAGDYACMSKERDVSDMVVVRQGAAATSLKDVYEDAKVLSSRNEKSMRITSFQYGGAREKAFGVAMEVKQGKTLTRIDCVGDVSHSSRAYYLCREMAERVVTAAPVEFSSSAEVRAVAQRINEAIAEGDLDHARSLWKKMPDDSMDKPALTVKLARLDGATGDALAVVEEYARLRHGNRGAGSTTESAMAAMAMGDTARAERYLTRALRWDKGYLPAYKTFAQLKLAAGASVDEVAALAKKYAQHAPASEKKKLQQIIEEADRSLTAE